MVNLVEENKTVTVDGNVTLTNVTSLQAGRPVLVKRINILPMFDHKHFKALEFTFLLGHIQIPAGSAGVR